MNLANQLAERFHTAIANLSSDPDQYAGMIRPTTDPSHGDYQFNGAMPLAKREKLGNPREVAQRIIDTAELSDMCQRVDIAGPGFINLKLRDDYLSNALQDAAVDPTAIVTPVTEPQTVLIDFSSPNVAKPMHVGHIRSTVIGDSLAKIFRSKGHHVITDNHLGDWGTQFGIIIYGYKHFGDPSELATDPIGHLSGLYRRIQALIEYQNCLTRRPTLQQDLQAAETKLRQHDSVAVDDTNAKAAKKHQKEHQNLQRRIKTLRADLDVNQTKIDAVQNDPVQSEVADQHRDVAEAVLLETAKLHQGDPENRRLWEQFLPHCREEIQRIYDRLSVTFDHTLGESFYHPMLEGVVQDLIDRDLATSSDGAICVFLPGYDSPMIVRKRDGAYLYATTDLATLQYREKQFDPQQILYVVDSRQSEHFEKLFAAAAAVQLSDAKLVHVNFGTVLGKDGRPMKTRSGSLIGLEGLLDDAVGRAAAVVCDPQRLQRFDPPMTEQQQQRVAEVVGIGAIKFADLSHHRTSDYRFDVEKMVALEGNTATYIQYQYARTQSILRRAAEQFGPFDPNDVSIDLRETAERDLALQLLRFESAIDAAIADYAPNILADYAIETARQYARFNDSCSVINAADPTIARSRMALVTISADILRRTLSLLGIETVDRM